MIFKIPMTEHTVISADEGAVVITQTDDSGNETTLYFAPELALLMAREVTKLAHRLIAERDKPDAP